jgi:hypothetical protein
VAPGGYAQPVAPGFGQPVEMGPPGGQPGYGQPGYGQPGGAPLPGGVQADPNAFPQQHGAPQPIAAPLAPGGAPGADAQPGSFSPDWYPDPWLQARIRYWDGNAWTGHTSN